MDAGGTSGVGPSVCPFVALVDDRDRRADGPDPRNRCYAEPAPRQRDGAYQAAYCYSPSFFTCGVFLGWAARNAAEPAYVVPASTRAPADADTGTLPGVPALAGQGGLEAQGGSLTTIGVTAEGGPGPGRTGETFDWVSASAWADVPADEHAREFADDPADDGEVDDEAVETGASADAGDGTGEGERAEAMTAPRVPAALPMRRRRRPQQPIRTRGSGEWYYSDPPDRQPLVRRRFGVAPPIALGVLGLLVVALVVFLLPTLLSSGGRDPGLVAAGPSGSPLASTRPTSRPAAARTPGASEAAATLVPSPRIRTYRVKGGDTLSGIAVRFGVPLQLLQCQNLLRNPNLISPGQELTIPPEGFTCPPGWRRAEPAPVEAE